MNLKKLRCFLVGHSWTHKNMTPENTSIADFLKELKNDTFVYCAKCKSYIKDYIGTRK